MFNRVKTPALSFALPLHSETHWSDMLVVLIATDPVPLFSAIGNCYDPATLVVTREASVDDADRPDIVLTAAGNRVAVIEVKVLAGLGPSQLERYHEAVPGAGVYALVYPERLAVPLHDAGPWQELTWEKLLRASRAVIIPGLLLPPVHGVATLTVPCRRSGRKPGGTTCARGRTS